MNHCPPPGHGDHPGARDAAIPLRDIRKRLPLRALDEQAWRHWTQKGYVIVPRAVSDEAADAVVDMLWQFQEMDRNDPATWYAPQRREHRMAELNNTGMVEVYHHQSLWNTRQSRRIHDAFVDIWDREDLWVAIDRANLNPPNQASRAAGNPDGFIHFDVDVSRRPLPIAAQGVLALATQDDEVGGFQCVPSLFAEIDDWWSRQPAGANPFKPDIGQRPIENVSLNKGDLLIFNSLLAHGVRPNHSQNRVRLAQYISMFPADPGNQALRDRRIRSWAEQTPPPGDPFPGDPREYERTHFARAELDAHGRRLLGLDPWP
ncbi:MAG TPA: phytanoyl-CoA dioxygenase family protein [Pseudomonas sp.]